ncbi:MAG: methyltransferase domain-containing protein [Acidobacteriota bacterium]
MMSTGFAMVGARAGDHVLVLGVPGPAAAALAAEIADMTGLNGRTVVVDVGAEARSRAEAAAAKAGALIEFEWAPVTMLPINAGTFDIAVINRQLVHLEGRNRVACCEEALRVVKPRGRVVVIEALQRPGLFGLLPSRQPGLPADAAREALVSAGARATRQLAEVDGVTYLEALSADTTANT